VPQPPPEGGETVLRDLGIPPNSRTLVYVGRLHPQKGLDWLLPLLPPLMERFPECHLLLVGDGPQRKRLESQAASLGIRTRIHFAGWRPDVPAILPACTGLVLPSRWEGMPNALLEAMAAGLPVVTTRAEGVSEILADQMEAQSAEFGDAAEFVARLETLLAEPSRAAAWGAANRRRVVRAFSWPARIADYERLYRTMASPARTE
jgi:glycosyltransferase involved in cell wall biosynthesis